MKKPVKFISILLTAVLLISTSGCGESPKKDSSSSVPASSDPSSSNQPSSEQEGNDYRQPLTPETESGEFVDTDGVFEYQTVDWQGPEGYVIVYPAGDNAARSAAVVLKDFYKEDCGVDLKIVTDKTAEVKKEILVGKTSRADSAKNLSESEMKVSLSGMKLIFDGGHNVTLTSAVNKYVRLAPEKGNACIFSLETDFQSTVLDGYEYVWGDEFEGADLDMTKWDFEERMSGSTKVEISWDRDVVDVGDGRLKLHGINYFNPLREGTRYKVPYSVVTKYKMNYVYGYAEIRARVPFEQGSWPSFWGLQIGANGGRNKTGGVAYDEEKAKNAKYGVEVDIFEVFGSLSKLEPTIHRHYNSGIYDYGKTHGVEGNHTTDGSYANWDWEERGADLETLSQEYHTYGFLWTEKEYSFYVDGIKYETIDITKSFDLCEDYQGFHEPLFLMFNNHVFADDMSYYENLVSDHSKLPFCYYIDWIRVYQKPGHGKIYIDTTPKSYVGR